MAANRGTIRMIGMELWEQYRAIYNYVDDWVVVKTNEDMTEITGFIVHRKHGEDRVETFEWK